MRHDKYVRILHRRAGLRELQRLLSERYLVVDGRAKQQILCEEAPYQDRFLSQDALSEIMGMLSALEAEEDKRLLRFELRERDEAQLPDSLKEKEDGREETTARPSRRGRRGGSDPSPAPAS